MSGVVDGVLDQFCSGVKVDLIMQLRPILVETRQPGLGGLAAILDADGDGSVIVDIIGGLSGR